LQYLLFQRRFGWLCVFWCAEEDENNNGRDASDGEINPETLVIVSKVLARDEVIALPIAR
jgi:hypothetical protein